MGDDSSGSRSFVGFLLVVIGIWLLLARLDIVDIGEPWNWIPSFFILLILWQMVRAGFRNVIGPLILIAIAVVIQIAIVGDEYGIEFDALWPLAIILAGVTVIVRGRWWGGRRSVTDGDLDILAVFCGSEDRITTSSFKGGRVTAVFGGAEIDLTHAGVDDPPATIDVTVLFGACELTVPSDWAVERRVFALFAGSSDKRRSVPDRTSEPQLVITGVVLFGGLEIKN